MYMFIFPLVEYFFRSNLHRNDNTNFWVTSGFFMCFSLTCQYDICTASLAVVLSGYFSDEKNVVVALFPQHIDC